MHFLILRFCILAGPFALILAPLGCGAAAEVDPGLDIGRAAGIAGAVEFRTTGEPLNVDGQDQQLTLADAVRRAIIHSPELQSALARVRAAQADAQQTRLWPNPILSLAFRFPSGGGESIIEAGLAADLVSILQQPRRADAADARLRAASAEALSSALGLIETVQKTYATVQALDAELIVLEERRKLIARLLALAKSRVEIGESAQLDVLTLDSDRVSLEVDVAQRESERRQRRVELARLIGQPSGAAEWAVPPFASRFVAVQDPSAWIQRALEHHPEVQARRWELQALGTEAETVWTLDGGTAGVDAERDGSWSVGPSISTPLPILDWGQARRRKAMAQVIQARHALVQTQRRVVQEVRQALESLASTQAALARVRDELIPLQERRIAQAEAAYRNGLADITAVIIAEQESQAARQKLIALQRDAATALFGLHRAAGGAAAFDAAATQPTSAPASTRATP